MDLRSQLARLERRLTDLVNGDVWDGLLCRTDAELAERLPPGAAPSMPADVLEKPTIDVQAERPSCLGTMIQPPRIIEP